jgi:hypothetical protein
VPDAPPRAPSAAQLGLGRLILIITAVAAASVWLRAILQLEEAHSGRLGLVVLIAAAGALLATLPLAASARLLAADWNRALRAGLAALWMGGLFIPAVLFCFAVEIRIIEGHVEAESAFDLAPRELFWSLFGAMGMFTPTGLRYVLPWPAPAVALVAAFCFYHWPQRTRA